ncbi:MAG: site-specific integrase [Alphaproteobacteria bacterium]|nr:site-specific integrase [Alphaproteobacteria bacterium]
MTQHDPNPFISPNLVTMAEVIDLVGADEALPLQRRRNICPSIRTLARALGLEPADIPAHVVFLRAMFERIHPEQSDVGRKRLQNIRSDVLFALRHAGLMGQGQTYMAPLTAEWQGLFDALVDRQFKYGLSRFMRFCSTQGIAPEAVDDQISDAFLVAMERETFVRRPKAVHAAVVRLWNRAAGQIDGWPDTRLTVPSRRQTYTLPWNAFPHSFRSEVETWLSRLRGDDLLAEEGPDDPLSPATIKARRFAVLQLASALVQRGHEVEAVDSLACLVDMDHAKEALAFFLERSGNDKTSQIHGLAYTLKLIAEKWLKVDAGHLAQLKTFCRRLNPGRTGLTDKNRARLRQLDDDRNKALLLDFPRRQLEQARRMDPGSKRAALKVQIGLAVELLLMTTIRVGNLAAINIERHLHRSRSSRKGIVHLVIPAAEVKNREDLEFELPQETAELLDLYLEEFHPRLTGGPSPWLFPGRNGKPKRGTGLSTRIKDQVGKATGLVVNAHLFRHITAKLYLDANPGGYEVVRRVLGHRSMDTTTSFYTGLETAAAARHFDDEILKIRKRVSNDD